MGDVHVGVLLTFGFRAQLFNVWSSNGTVRVRPLSREFPFTSREFPFSFTPPPAIPPPHAIPGPRPSFPRLPPFSGPVRHSRPPSVIPA